MGALDERWSDLLEGDITTSDSADGGLVATLIGRFRDQAALIGLLNALYDWHFPLLRLEYLAEPAEAG